MEFRTAFQYELCDEEGVQRACNVHQHRLIQGRSSTHGGHLLFCPHPTCSVGMWSTASASTPASQEVRTLRKLVFDKANQREYREQVIDRMRELQEQVGPSKAITIGCLNKEECERILDESTTRRAARRRRASTKKKPKKTAQEREVLRILRNAEKNKSSIDDIIKILRMYGQDEAKDLEKTVREIDLD